MPKIRRRAFDALRTWRVSDAQLLTASLFLAGILSVTSRMPSVWEYTDPWLYLLFDGGWEVAETFYGVLLAVFFVFLAHRILPFRSWPWAILIVWLPYGAWTLASMSWARFPDLSRVVWFFTVLAQPVGLALGFAIGRNWRTCCRPVFASLLLLLAYLCIRLLLDSSDLNHRGFNTVMLSTWLVMCLPVLVFGISMAETHRQELLAFMLAVTAVLIGVLVPQRMAALASVLCLLAILACTFHYHAEPQHKDRWRAYVLALAVLNFWLYLHFASSKPASILPGEGGLEGAWYRVFVNSERYEIFRYWFARGAENLWQGVGLGWELPAIAYNYRYVHDMKIDPLGYSHGHNMFMNIWLQTGLIGLAAFILWLSVIFFGFARRLHAQEKVIKRLGVTGIGLILVMILRNFSDDGFREANVYLWFTLMGVFLGGLQMLAAERAESIKTRKGTHDGEY